MSKINNQVLVNAVELLEKKVNFRCDKYPERLECETCTELRECEAKHITWNCNGDLRFFEESLKQLEVIDINPYIDYVEEHGGYCDCEILFNVVEDSDYKKRFIKIKQLLVK